MLIVDIIPLEFIEFITGVKIKATADSKLEDSTDMISRRLENPLQQVRLEIWQIIPASRGVLCLRI